MWAWHSYRRPQAAGYSFRVTLPNVSGRWEEKHVWGIMPGELTGAYAKIRSDGLFAEARAVACPDHDKLHRGTALLRPRYVAASPSFLWRNSPYVSTARSFSAPHVCCTAASGVRAGYRRLDPDTDISSRRFADGRRSLVPVCLSCGMKPAELVEDQLLHPAQMIVLGVVVEVGMKAAKYRNPQAPGCLHRRPSERPLCCYIHHIWTVVCPAPLEQPARWQADMHPFIPR